MIGTVEGAQPTNQQSETGDASPYIETPGVETGDDEKVQTPENNEENWEDDPRHPYNWPTHSKVLQVLMMASAAFTT